jgi:hypothetical protein
LAQARAAFKGGPLRVRFMAHHMGEFMTVPFDRQDPHSPQVFAGEPC